MSMSQSRQRFQLSVSVFCVLKQGDEFLLILRSNTGYLDNMFSLPAGAIEGSESVTAATCREAFEEVGVTVSENNLKQSHLMHCTVDGNEWLNIFFVAEQWDGTPAVKEPHKHSEVKWLSTAELPENTIPYIRQALEHIEKNSRFSEFGWKV